MNDALLRRALELRDLDAVIKLAQWDRETNLPANASAARSAQLATLHGLYHERLVDPRLGEWLAVPDANDVDDEASRRVLARERNRALTLSATLVRDIAEAQASGLAAWNAARAQRSFSLFRPHLERLVVLRRTQADAYGYDGGERYDALLDLYEPGMRVQRLEPVLTSLKHQLLELLKTLDARPKPRNVFAGHVFDAEAQWRFTMQLLPALGFDLKAGRQDRSVHPFTMALHPADVRLTTRLNPTTPLPAIFGTLHEAGHGLYEQGLEPHGVLGQALSMGLHESQSRLWENLVGRDAPFWRPHYPALQAAFPEALGGVSLDDFLATVNTVERTFIRVEADEVTYNLHIVLRFELELALFRGQLAVADLEAAWNEKTQALFGLGVTSPLEGVLQDIHWAWGDFGYFPTYALGNLYAASLMAAARRALPDLDEQLAAGITSGLLGWLRTQVHHAGARFDAEEVVRRATGTGLTDVDFIAALHAKYAHRGLAPSSGPTRR
ncbi:MAG: carboxypeptidase M32 [Archangium sp.]|nr:carboxypeptidase M32 [Archangium sp.]